MDVHSLFVAGLRDSWQLKLVVGRWIKWRSLSPSVIVTCSDQMVSALESDSTSGHPHLFDRLTFDIGLFAELVWQLAHLLSIPDRLFEIPLPFFNTISCSFGLQTLKNCLVFNCYFYQLLSSYVSVHRRFDNHFYCSRLKIKKSYGFRYLLGL